MTTKHYFKLNNILSQVLLRMLMVLLILPVADAWGHGGTHYFQGTAIVSSQGTGSGKVYVTNKML